MVDSYLILDEKLRFLDGTTKLPVTDSILNDPGAIDAALSAMNGEAFEKRKGDFYLQN